MNFLDLISKAKSRKIPPHYIHEIRITPLFGGGGLHHSLYIRSGEFEFTGNFDNNLHNFYSVVEEAMKFFGQKYGIITIDSDGIVKPTKKGLQ